MAHLPNEKRSIATKPSDLSRIIFPRAVGKNKISQTSSSSTSSHGIWCQVFAPYLECFLTYHGPYSSKQTEQQLELFQVTVSPWLGPATPYVGPGSAPCSPEKHLFVGPQHPSPLTNEHTPLEITCSWRARNKGGKPAIGYTVDIASANPGGPNGDRMTSITRTISAVNTLQNFVDVASKDSLQLALLSGGWDLITNCLRLYEIHEHMMQCEDCYPSSTFISFDIGQQKTDVNVRWLLPTCKTTNQLTDLLDKTFKTISRMQALLNAWQTVKEHIASDEDNLRLHSFSLNAAEKPYPQFQIYVRCLIPPEPHTFEDIILPHLTLDENDAVYLAGPYLDICDDLYTSLTDCASSTSKTKSPANIDDKSQPKYATIIYTISTTPCRTLANEQRSITISSMLQIPTSSISHPDAFIANEILTQCPATKGSKLLESFAEQETDTRFIQGVGLKVGGPEREDVIVEIGVGLGADFGDCVEGVPRGHEGLRVGVRYDGRGVMR